VSGVFQNIDLPILDANIRSGAFLTPGSGMGGKSASGSGIRDEQLDHIFQSLEIIFLVFCVKILKFFDADPGWKKVGSGINIPDPQHWRSA
jgi:hypothetical protein